MSGQKRAAAKPSSKDSSTRKKRAAEKSTTPDSPPLSPLSPVAARPTTRVTPASLTTNSAAAAHALVFNQEAVQAAATTQHAAAARHSQTTSASGGATSAAACVVAGRPNLPSPASLGTDHSLASQNNNRVLFSYRSGVLNTRTEASITTEVDHEAGSTNAPTNPADWYETCREKGRLGSEGVMELQFVSYVRKDLFPKLKFVMNKNQMKWSTDPNSLCSLIRTELRVKDMFAEQWWETHSNLIVQTLNAKRADVTASIKRAFMSK